MMSKRIPIGLAGVALVAAAVGLIAARDAAPPIAGTVVNFTPAETPRPVPETRFTDLAGRPHTLAHIRGRVVALNLWATWCGPCIREMPSLDRLQAELGGEDFTVVLMSQDRLGAEQVEPFLARLGIGLTSQLDPKMALFRALGGRGLPTTILIDARGIELGRLEGAAEWDRPEALALIRYYLD